MNKMVMLNAILEGGKVKVNGHEIDGAIVGSAGSANSAGVLLLDGAKAVYFANTSSDLSDTLDKTSEALGEIATAMNDIAQSLTLIAGNMTGNTTAPPPALPAKVVLIQAAATQVDAIAAELDELRGDLK